MPSEPTQEATAISDDLASELVRLLTSQLFEDFIGLYKTTADSLPGEGAVTLAEVVNDKIKKTIPDCEVKLMVSQKTNNKHIVMINDGSKFFGPGWTVSRQMFVI